MVNRVRAVAAQLAAVRAHLTPLLETPTKETLEKLAPLERARLEVAAAFGRSCPETRAMTHAEALPRVTRPASRRAQSREAWETSRRGHSWARF